MTYLQEKALNRILELTHLMNQTLDRREDLRQFDPDIQKIASHLSEQEDWIIALREEEINNL